MPEAQGEGLDQDALRRRHPAERVTSRWSGILLLVAIPHAAFGYALVDLVPGAGWVRTAHFLVAWVVLLLVLLLFRAVRRLPWRGNRERLLSVLSLALVALVAAQILTGSWMRWGLSGAASLQIVHVGTGILSTLIVALAHVVAILPSILVSARREHARVNAQRRR